MAENYFGEDPLRSSAHSPAPSFPTGQDFNDLLMNLNLRLQSLEAKNMNVSSVQSSTLSPKVSLPEKFSGQISKFRDFIISVENVFALQPARYPTDQVKTRFIGTLLTNEALAWFRDVVMNRSRLLDNYAAFLLEFTNLFDDPNAKKHACAALKRLRQAKGSCL